MAIPMARDQFENVTNLGLALRTVFYDQLRSVNEPGSDLFQFFGVESSNRAVERNQGVGGFGDVPAYDGSIKYDDFELLYRKSYEHVEYAKGIAIERKLIDDEEYGVINTRAERLGISFDRTRYKHAASVFNNAFTASTDASTGGDTKALVADDHPLSPSDSSTQSNEFTYSLTYDNLLTVERAMMAFTDSKGNPMDVMPDTLVVPLALKGVAETIVKSPLQPGTGNNDSNNAAGYNLVVSRYLTDTNAWFLVDSRLSRTYLKWYNHTMPEFKESADSDYNLVLRFRGYMRYVFGFDHWVWIAGSNPS